MKLVIGGYAQGKLEYVLGELQCEDEAGNPADEPEKGSRESRKGNRTEAGHSLGLWKVYEGIPSEEELENGGRIVVNHLHRWVKERIRQGGCPEEEALSFAAVHPGCVIICDEVGNGIVPMDGFEREYRERTGRLLVRLAAEAEEVVRVICGIGQKIK